MVTTTKTLEENINHCSGYLKKKSNKLSSHMASLLTFLPSMLYKKFSSFNKSFRPEAQEDDSNRILHSVTTGCIQNLGITYSHFFISLKVVSLSQEKGVSVDTAAQ